MPVSWYECNGLSESLAMSVLIGSSLCALGLGLFQTLPDLRTDSHGYLWDRPVATRGIFRGKVFAGFVAHFLTWIVPLLITGIYLEWIGPEQLPVSWVSVVLSRLLPVSSGCNLGGLPRRTVVWHQMSATGSAMHHDCMYPNSLRAKSNIGPNCCRCRNISSTDCHCRHSGGNNRSLFRSIPRVRSADLSAVSRFR